MRAGMLSALFFCREHFQKFVRPMTGKFPFKEEVMRSTFKLFIIGLFVSSSLAACNLPSGTPNAAATLQAVYTAQAATVQALQTQARVTLTPVPGVVFPTL